MANYYGTTASNGGKVKEGKAEELQAYIEKWGFQGEDDLFVGVQGNFLHIYGGEDFAPCPIITKEEAENDKNGYLEEGEMWDDGDPEAFLEGLAPFLEVQGEGKDKNLIVVHTVGAEKCRFPLGACEYILRPTGKVDYNGFKIFS